MCCRSMFVTRILGAATIGTAPCWLPGSTLVTRPTTIDSTATWRRLVALVSAYQVPDDDRQHGYVARCHQAPKSMSSSAMISTPATAAGTG